MTTLKKYLIDTQKQVAYSKENQPSTDSHLKNTGGITTDIGGINATSLSHNATSKTEVANDKPAWNKAEDHLTTSATSYQTEENTSVLETSVEVEL